MRQQIQVIKPQFHYNYEGEAVILATQYNYQGNMLAVSNSNGQILFYGANCEDTNRQVLFSIDKRKANEKKSPAVIKIAWSLPSLGLFATATISRELELYKCRKNSMQPYICCKCQYIPVFITFCPIETEVILSVGFSGGIICFYNETLSQMLRVDAHDQAVNCLSWQHKILNYEKNKWIVNNFPQVARFKPDQPVSMLASCSSDSHIKIWRYEEKQLIECAKVKAHLKGVREVQWKPNYLVDSERIIISCSEDGYVKIWRVRSQGLSIVLENRCERNFGGPVYCASFNFVGTLIAISYCNEAEQRVETIILKDSNNSLGQQIKFQV